MELVPKAEFSIVTRASKAWIPELIAAAGPGAGRKARKGVSTWRCVGLPDLQSQRSFVSEQRPEHER